MSRKPQPTRLNTGRTYSLIWVLPTPPYAVRPATTDDVIDLTGQNALLVEPHNPMPSGRSGAEGTHLRTSAPTPLVSSQERARPQGSVSQREAMRSQSVAVLVQLAGEGCPKAWQELVSRFGGMIAATGRRYRLTPADVAELQQTTWLRLVENLHKIEQPERVGGWLATTARRESLQLLRRASKYHSGADQMMANMPDRHLPDPDARPIAEERDAVLRAAWERMKPRCRELLALLITDDPMGYKHLSQLLQMPVGSIGPTRARCLEHLKSLVVEEGIGTF